MEKRQSLSESFDGAPDENIMKLLGECGEDYTRTVNLKKILLKIINNELLPRQKQIIMLYYFKGKNTVEIAEIIGATQQSVSRSLKRARLTIFRILRYYF